MALFLLGVLIPWSPQISIDVLWYTRSCANTGAGHLQRKQFTSLAANLHAVQISLLGGVTKIEWPKKVPANSRIFCKIYEFGLASSFRKNTVHKKISLVSLRTFLTKSSDGERTPERYLL